jgi:toxin ParE1/3/4
VRRLELTHSAEDDLVGIFDRSAEAFGARARRRYEALVATALRDLTAHPSCAGSLDRPELGRGVRTYHLRYCRARGKASGAQVRNHRHLLAYEFDDERILVLRVLHDAMDLARHIPESEAGEGLDSP